MKSFLLLVHPVFAGLWLGCVLTEVLFERALREHGKNDEVILAGLHRSVDLFVELPVFLVVPVTGALMLAHINPGTVLYMKIGFGILAILANIYCGRI